MDSKTIKIRKGNAKTFKFLTDSKEDKVDMCIYEDGEKLCEIRATNPTQKWEEWEYTVRLPEDVSEELGEGDLEYELRTNSEPFEEGTLSLYSKKKANEDDSDKD
jgi:hypothetical protein